MNKVREYPRCPVCGYISAPVQLNRYGMCRTCQRSKEIKEAS
jgi:ribosomal protein S14